MEAWIDSVQLRQMSLARSLKRCAWCFFTSLYWSNLQDSHQSLGNPGYARVRLHHFVRQRNLPFSSEETKNNCRNYKTCARIKSQFFQPASQIALIKAIRPWDRVCWFQSASTKASSLPVCRRQILAFICVFPYKNMTDYTFADCLSSRSCVLSFPGCIYSSFFEENVRYLVWACRDPISLILGTQFSLILGTRC